MGLAVITVSIQLSREGCLLTMTSLIKKKSKGENLTLYLNTDRALKCATVLFDSNGKTNRQSDNLKLISHLKLNSKSKAFNS